MDTNNKSIINLGGELVDITELPVVGLIQGIEGKAIVKQLPVMPAVVCCKSSCVDLASHLVQFVGNDLTFLHLFSCESCLGEVISILDTHHADTVRRTTNASN